MVTFLSGYGVMHSGSAAKILGIVGCGRHGESHQRAFSRQYPLQRVTLYSLSPPSAHRVGGIARSLGVDVALVNELREAVDGQAIFVSSIPKDSNTHAFLHIDWIENGQFRDHGRPESGLASGGDPHVRLRHDRRV